MQTVWESGACKAQSMEPRACVEVKSFLPLSESPSQNIHSLLIKRETNKHTQLAVAILKSPKAL